MNAQQILAKNIKRIMQEKGYKQKFVAARAGFEENTFSNMLNQRKLIRAEHVPIIAAALNVSANDLFDNPTKSA